MASKHICPKCGCKRFHVTAHVTQGWMVDETGEYIACIAECDEILHQPDDEDVWTCSVCGAEAIINKEDEDENNEPIGKNLYIVNEEAIRNAPTFEADPVKYGHWIDNADSYICSECRYETDNPNKNPCGPGRCPKCFAKMDVRKPDCRTCTYFAGGAGSFECTGCADHSSWEERK